MVVAHRGLMTGLRRSSMKVGDLVQQKPHYRSNGRWAIVVRSDHWDDSCIIRFTDNGAKHQVYKKSLIVFSKD